MKPITVITTRPTPESVCPYCFKMLDAATGVNGTPFPGAYTMCGECNNVLVFTETLHVRKMRPEEEERFKNSPGAQATRAFFRRATEYAKGTTNS